MIATLSPGQAPERGLARRTPSATTIAFCLALALAPLHAAADDKAQWLRKAEAANALSYQCFGEENDADCVAMIAHYDAAMAAPDADESIRHELFKYRMNAVSARGGNLLEAGDAEKAMRVLNEGYTQVAAHYAGGTHAHTIIDNLRLQGHFLAALATTGHTDDAEAVADTARRMAQAHYDQRERLGQTEHGEALLAEAVIRSEELETRYGDALSAHAARLQAQDPDRTHFLELSIAAYRNAINWVRRADEAGFTMPFEGTNPIRFAELNNSLGKALLATGDREAAVEAHNLAFAAARCKALGNGTMDDYDKISAVRPCNAAVSGYMAASGETKRLASDMAEAMYQQQMELYRTDISELLRRAPAGGD